MQSVKSGTTFCSPLDIEIKDEHQELKKHEKRQWKSILKLGSNTSSIRVLSSVFSSLDTATQLLSACVSLAHYLIQISFCNSLLLNVTLTSSSTEPFLIDQWIKLDTRKEVRELVVTLKTFDSSSQSRKKKRIDFWYGPTKDKKRAQKLLIMKLSRGFFHFSNVCILPSYLKLLIHLGWH